MLSLSFCARAYITFASVLRFSVSNDQKTGPSSLPTKSTFQHRHRSTDGFSLSNREIKHGEMSNLLKNIFIYVWQLPHIRIRFESPGSEWSEDWSFFFVDEKLTNTIIFEYFSISSSLNDIDDGEKKLSDLMDSSSAWYSGRLCACSKLMTVSSWGRISARMAFVLQIRLNVFISKSRLSFSIFFICLISSVISRSILSSSERFCNNLTKLFAIFVFKFFTS